MEFTVTTGIAVYGAIVSTVALVLARRDKTPRLRVSGSFSVNTWEQGLQLTLKAANPGEKEVTLSCHGFILPGRKKLITSPRDGVSIPVRIPANSSHVTWTPLASVVVQLRRQGYSGYIRVRPFCIDACERMFTGRALPIDIEGSFD